MRSDVFAPVSGRITPLLDEVGTNAAPRAVNDGSCGVVTAAYETPAVAAESAALATSTAGEGRRRSLRMDGSPSRGRGLRSPAGRSRRANIPWCESGQRAP